jgi:hypothetical protein
MHFSDDAWALCRQQYGYADSDRRAIERQLTGDWRTYEARAKGNLDCALALLEIDAACAWARRTAIEKAPQKHEPILAPIGRRKRDPAPSLDGEREQHLLL